MKYVFVINPVAGKRKLQLRAAALIKDYFNANGGNYEIYYTKGNGDATEYARTLAQTGEQLRIYACGGEGTTFEVLNGIVGYDNVSLGVIPCGTANDFSRFFANRELFFDISDQIDGDVLTLDLIRAGEYYAINSCSVGMDAMTAANMNKFKRWPLVSGSMAYVLALVYTLFSRLGVQLEITVDGKQPPLRQKSLFAVIANAPYYGGGFYPVPTSKPYDGHLDYSVISVMSRFKILSLLKLYRAGEHIHRDFCKSGVCNTLRVVADRTVPMNLDGEIVFIKDADFEIVPKALQLILPRSISGVWLERAGQTKQTANM